MSLLEVRNLAVEFEVDGPNGRPQTLRAVDGVSFSVNPGETLGIVGESGSGKSVSQLALLGLISPPVGRVVSGLAAFDGEDLLTASPARLRAVRGKRISMIFQDPLTSLNPFLSIGEQLTEVVRLHEGVSMREARSRAAALLGQVGIPAPEQRLDSWPHQLSGGMRQRVMIAMALLCRPQLLIADEPTTALDVTVQAQILRLLKSLQERHGMAIILITHHLGIVAQTCDRVQVMYAGRIAEQGTVREVFAAPQHPYTQGLLRSLPRLDTPRTERLLAIPGRPPLPTELPQGCAFAPRCGLVRPVCREKKPPLYGAVDGRRHACIVAAGAAEVAV